MKTIDTGKVKLGFVEFSGGDYAFLVDDNGTHFKDNLVIGRLSEITEEQARELVEDHCYYANALWALYSIARKLGIPEKDFNKYLVIKLN